MSVAVATIGENDHHESSIRLLPGAIETSSSFMFHRFTMIKPASKQQSVGAITTIRHGSKGGVSKRYSIGWSPFYFFLGRTRKQSNSGSSMPAQSTKCDLCGKRLGLGYKTVLECDDCGLRVHVKCGEFAPKDCGTRLMNRAAPTKEGALPMN